MLSGRERSGRMLLSENSATRRKESRKTKSCGLGGILPQTHLGGTEPGGMVTATEVCLIRGAE